MRIVFGIILLCALFASNEAFGLGTERTFSLLNNVQMYDLKNPQKPTGYQIEGSLKVGTVWGNDEDKLLLKFELQNPKLLILKYQGDNPQYVEKKSILDNHKNSVFYAEWQQGVIPKVYHTKAVHDDSLENFQKSLVSLFQYQLLDSNSVENDISGNCDVTYISKSSSKYEKHKTKCRFTDDGFHKRLEEPLGVDLKSSQVIYYTVVPDGTPDIVHSTEYHRIKVNAYPDVGSVVESQIMLKFDGRISDIPTFKGNTIEDVEGLLENFSEQDLLPRPEPFSNDNLNLVKLIKEHKDDLADDHIGKHTSALGMLKILEAAKLAKAEDFLRVLKAQSTQSIKYQLVDLLAATQTKESHEAFKKSFDFSTEEDLSYIESYLQSLAVGTRPNESVLEDLFNTLQSNEITDDNVKQSIVQTISAMSQRFATLPENNYKSQIVEKITNFLLKSFKECESVECKVMYLRGFRNLGAPATIDTLLEYSTATPYVLSVAAMKALRSFPVDNWQKPQIRKKFENIFYQRFNKFDSSARTLALDILLDLNPTKSEIREMLAHLNSNDKAFEVKQYLIQKFNMLSENCPRIRALLTEIVKEEPRLANWNVFGSQKGLSTVLTRQFSGFPSFNGSILSVQEMSGGVLKRGNVDLLVASHQKKFSIFTMGLFASGLSSYTKSENAEEEEEESNEDSTAGMELAIQGVQMRPLVFFKGQGELMGHIWSGTASEKTPAYQGITLLQDHSQIIHLHNGATLILTINGAVSVDLNGKIEISLWSRNADIRVEQNTGLALTSNVHIHSPIVSLESDLTVTESPQLQLQSKLELSGGPTLCMQLSQPNTILKQRISNLLSVPYSNYKLRQAKNLTYNIIGRSYALNRKNNEMCNKIHRDR